jgi:hypothetical protein
MSKLVAMLVLGLVVAAACSDGKVEPARVDGGAVNAIVSSEPCDLTAEQKATIELLLLTDGDGFGVANYGPQGAALTEGSTEKTAIIIYPPPDRGKQSRIPPCGFTEAASLLGDKLPKLPQ